jgi:DNA-binding NtrC family response regulator
MARDRKSTSSTPATDLRGRLKDLSTTLTSQRVMKLRDARRSFERDYVTYVIDKLGDRGEAARALGIGLSTLKEKIRAPRGQSTRSTRVAPQPDRSSARR